MIGDDGVARVIEYNCRFGDPETQPIMMRLKSNLAALCVAAVEGRLDQVSADWDSRVALGVVMAAGGYPESYSKGDEIVGLTEADANSVKVFHAGTILDDKLVVTNGGRVLCVTALGNSVSEAQRLAYEAVDKISWNDAYVRTDIGHRAIARENRVTR
jgi:phosphoribosylamine--glycine ligase